MPSLFSLREFGFRRKFPGAFPHNSPSRWSTEPALPRRGSYVPGRWVPAPAALAASTAPGRGLGSDRGR